jgi:hypothetical protein
MNSYDVTLSQLGDVSSEFRNSVKDAFSTNATVIILLLILAAITISHIVKDIVKEFAKSGRIKLKKQLGDIVAVAAMEIASIAFLSVLMPDSVILYFDAASTILIVLGLFSVFITYLLTQFMVQRTPYVYEIYSKILGFKNFLETAEKDKLDALMDENPEYFHDMLPYAYVLGVSDKWVGSFESIFYYEPEWTCNGKPISIRSANDFMNNIADGSKKNKKKSKI